MSKNVIRGYVLYRYTCESCGKETDWLRKDVQYIKEPDKRRPTESFMSGGRMESWAAPASAAAGESAGDRENRERREQRLLNGLFAVIRSKADSGNYAEFDKGSSCPFCRARQSWCNATPLGDIVLSAVGTAVLFAAAAVILSLVLSRYGPWGTVVPIIACALLGSAVILFRTVLPYIRCKKEVRLAKARGNSLLPEIDWNVVRKPD